MVIFEATSLGTSETRHGTTALFWEQDFIMIITNYFEKQKYNEDNKDSDNPQGHKLNLKGGCAIKLIILQVPR